MDALIGICEQHLANQAAGASADRAEIYQLVVHATLDDLKNMGNEDSAATGITLGGLGTGKLRIHPATAARLACDCPVSVVIEDESGTPLHLNRKQRRVLGRLRRAVQIRDGGMCRAPGCTEPATQIHHIKHWVDLGDTCLENLISLCDGHHWAVHEGGFTVVTRSPGRWAFLSENGVTIEPEPDVPSAATALPFDTDIAADASTGGWDGSRLSPSHVNDIVAPLLKAAEREDTPAGASSRTNTEIGGWAAFLKEHAAVIDPGSLDSTEEWQPSDWPEEYEHAQDVSDWLRDTF